MTREDIEEMNDIRPYSFETDREEKWYEIGCIDGVDAADAEPDATELWHDAIIMPQERYENIIYQTNFCSIHNVHIAFIPTCLRSCKITSNSWNEFVKDVNMRRWAYIKDLLPKGGKL